MSLQGAISDTNPTGYTHRAWDETIVITKFVDVEPTPGTGGYSKWPSYYCTRTNNWNSLSEDEKKLRLQGASALREPEDHSSSESWRRSLSVGGGWDSSATWMCEVLKEVNDCALALP